MFSLKNPHRGRSPHKPENPSENDEAYFRRWGFWPSFPDTASQYDNPIDYKDSHEKED